VSEPWRTLLTLAAGLATGLLSGMFGVGGAVVSTPAIRALGATPLQAVGSTLPSIIPSAVSGSLRYHREGLLLGSIALWTALPGSVAAVGGALLTSVLPGGGHPLMILTAGLLVITSARMRQPPRVRVGADDGDDSIVAPVDDTLVAARPTPPRGARRATPLRAGAVGIAAGLLSGLLGIGGGVLIVPAYTGWLRLRIKEAVATSLLCVGILAVPGTITHTLLGHIDWAFAVPLSIAVIPGARAGAALAIRAADDALRLTVALVLGVIAVGYGVSELIAVL